MPCLEYAENAPGPADFSAGFSQLLSEPHPVQQQRDREQFEGRFKNRQCSKQTIVRQYLEFSSQQEESLQIRELTAA